MNASPEQTPARILIIDDNASVHEALRKSLERTLASNASLDEAHATLFNEAPEKKTAGRSFIIDSAYSGMEGVQHVTTALAQGQPYALAFVDMRMPPGWDGVETIRRLWAQSAELHIVICTAFSDYSWEQIVGELGDTDRMVVLRKPFEREEVLQLAHMMTRKWQRERQQSLVSTEPNSDEPFRLLMLEDEPLTAAFLTKKLKAAFPHITVLPARCLAEGHAHLAENAIDFFLLDIFLPDGTGIDFLFQAMTLQPNARAALMTGQALGEYRVVAEQMGVLKFFEKPVNIPELAGTIRDQIDAKNAASQGMACFAATLTRLTTIDIIQLKCLSKATATLDFVRRDGTQGRVWFEQGEIVHAAAPGLSGEAAFAEIVGWRNGRAVEIPGATVPERSIETAWQNLLLNSAHSVDEASAGGDKTRAA